MKSMKGDIGGYICCGEWPFWRKIKRENNKFSPMNYPNYHFSLHDPFAISVDYFGLFEILRPD